MQLSCTPVPSHSTCHSGQRGRLGLASGSDAGNPMTELTPGLCRLQPAGKSTKKQGEGRRNEWSSRPDHWGREEEHSHPVRGRGTRPKEISTFPFCGILPISANALSPTEQTDTAPSAHWCGAPAARAILRPGRRHAPPAATVTYLLAEPSDLPQLYFLSLPPSFHCWGHLRSAGRCEA